MPDRIEIAFSHHGTFSVIRFGHRIHLNEAICVTRAEPYRPARSDWPQIGPILEAIFKAAGNNTTMFVDVTYKELTVNDPPRSLWGDCLEPVVLGCLAAAGISYVIQP